MIKSNYHEDMFMRTITSHRQVAITALVHNHSLRVYHTKMTNFESENSNQRVLTRYPWLIVCALQKKKKSTHIVAYTRTHTKKAECLHQTKNDKNVILYRWTAYKYVD